jgi:tRNA(His) guanylyltransferase
MKDDLGTRMKTQYEVRTKYFVPRRTYTIIRMDGKAFHTFTRGMERPYDTKLIDTMNMTAIKLCEEIQGCVMAYTQSDEISLLLTDFTTITTDAWFDGNIQKMASVSASIATGYFNYYLNQEAGPSQRNPAFFDSRVFTIPDPIEVENYFIWRQKDATRNSLSMLAQSLYSHKELQGKSQTDMHEMIYSKGKNWDHLPAGFKRGRTFIKSTYKKNGIEKTAWSEDHPDFLSEREFLTQTIPQY